MIWKNSGEHELSKGLQQPANDHGFLPGTCRFPRTIILVAMV